MKRLTDLQQEVKNVQDTVLDDLNLPCESRREMWGEKRSLVEAWFGLFSTEPDSSTAGPPTEISSNPPTAGPKPSPHSTILFSNSSSTAVDRTSQM